VDVASPDPEQAPVKAVRALESELKKFSEALATRERWLVINKLDLLSPDEREGRVAEIVKDLRWKGPVFSVSAATGEGCHELAARLMERIEARRREQETDSESQEQ